MQRQPREHYFFSHGLGPFGIPTGQQFRDDNARFHGFQLTGLLSPAQDVQLWMTLTGKLLLLSPQVN